MARVQKSVAELSQVVGGDRFGIHQYTPTPVRPFYIHMEPLSLRKRVRFFFESLAGYTVYYLLWDGMCAGYCVIARGGAGRYRFATDSDILVGPIFIHENYRGQRLSTLLLREALALQRGKYVNAYAYIDRTNTPSLAAFQAAGFKRYRNAKASPILRRLFVAEDGDFVLVRKQEEQHG